MASKDRMIVPFVCTECGAPLNRKKSVCEFCRVGWEMVKRYEGPELPQKKLMVMDKGAWTTASYYGSTAMMFNSCNESTYSSSGTPIYEMGKKLPIAYVSPSGEIVNA